jgi:hypothetical protein
MGTRANKTQHPAYRNQPLEPTQIRLLSLQTTHLQHVFLWVPHRLKLVTTRHNLEDEPDFAAVSYVWGDAPASVSIPCNGSSISITSNVYEMLERFRLFGLPVWIDAICINQEDIEEKRTQIPFIQKIYRTASNVYVWMGSSNLMVMYFMLDFGRVMELSRTWTPQLPTGHPDWRGEGWPDDQHQFWGGVSTIYFATIGSSEFGHFRKLCLRKDQPCLLNLFGSMGMTSLTSSEKEYTRWADTLTTRNPTIRSKSKTEFPKIWLLRHVQLLCGIALNFEKTSLPLVTAS